jgi:hypothetical protein
MKVNVQLQAYAALPPEKYLWVGYRVNLDVVTTETVHISGV